MTVSRLGFSVLNLFSNKVNQNFKWESDESTPEVDKWRIGKQLCWA